MSTLAGQGLQPNALAGRGLQPNALAGRGLQPRPKRLFVRDGVCNPRGVRT
jgi:hypothetical protein